MSDPLEEESMPEQLMAYGWKTQRLQAVSQQLGLPPKAMGNGHKWKSGGIKKVNDCKMTVIGQWITEQMKSLITTKNRLTRWKIIPENSVATECLHILRHMGKAKQATFTYVLQPCPPHARHAGYALCAKESYPPNPHLGVLSYWPVCMVVFVGEYLALLSLLIIYIHDKFLSAKTE